MARPNKISRRERPRADGSIAVDYVAQIRVRGRLHTHCSSTERAAASWLADQRRARAALEPGPPGTVTYDQAAKLLREHWEAAPTRTLTQRTHQGYLQELAILLLWWGPLRIAETTRPLIEKYVAECREKGLASGTIANRLGRVSQLHKIAVRHGLLAAACPVERPRKIVRTPRKALSEPALETLLAGCKDDRERATILLAAEAGLRRAEIPRLLGEDVTLVPGENDYGWLRVAVRDEKDRPKSGHERRVPILTPRLAAALKGCFPAPGRPVVGAHGGSTVRRRVEEISARAGLDRRCMLHELRHRWVTRLLEGGEALTAVMAWAGHTSVATTMRYTHAGTAPTSAGCRALQISPPSVHQRKVKKRPK